MKIHKIYQSKRRIEDLPDNLLAWLKRTPPEAFKMTHRHMLHRRSMAFKRAGLLIEADDISRENEKRDRKGLELVDLKPKCPPKNALRHSFVTYHVALHRNPGKTALIVSPVSTEASAKVEPGSGLSLSPLPWDSEPVGWG